MTEPRYGRQSWLKLGGSVFPGAGPVPELGALIDFIDRYNACLHEVGQEPVYAINFSLDRGLSIIGYEPSEEWEAAALKALRLLAPTFPPAAHLLSMLDSRVVTHEEAVRWIR